MERKKRNLKQDEQAVSPVVGVIMLIAITVVIAAVVAAFAYGIIGGVKKAPNAAFVIEGTTRSSENITIIHHGGDTIPDAFATGNQLGDAANWSALEVRINGAVYTNNVTSGGKQATMNSAAIGAADFQAGDELQLPVNGIGISKDTALESGDTIAVVYTPTGDLLQRVLVS